MNTTDGLKTEQQALLAALERLLEPVAELCLAKGVAIQSVEELIRHAFVKAARQACAGANPDRLTSRISTMTGLTRREVDRIESTTLPELPATRSPATDLLTHWVSQAGYGDSLGRPLPIARQGPAPSFESLATQVTKDVHPRSLLAEMVRLGLVAVNPDDDTVALQHEAFVPRGNWPQMLAYLGSNVGDHLRAAVTNVMGTGNEHFEQALTADELSAESLQQARQMIAQQWRTLMTTLGPQLQALMDADRVAERPQDQALRIGLYSWAYAMPVPENESPAATPAPRPESKT